MAVGNLLYSIDPSKGETPETVAQRRQMSNLIAARMLGTAPKNVGEGLNAIGQALIARSMMGDADAAQKAGEASLPDFIKAQITGQTAVPSVATPPAVAAAPMGGTSIPVSQADTGPVVPNDANAFPGTVGMNMALADRSQDFIQDNPNTYLSSGVRSTADQARLYADRGNNPNPVARPGTSNHERGMAIDIGGMTPSQRAMLPQYGLAQPVANDPPHVELAKATDAPSPLDTAQWPVGPVGAPGVQVAQTDPQTANDGAELPANAQPTGGALPTAQAVQQASQPRSQSYGGPFANVSTQDLTKAAFNPWLKASNPAAAAAISAEITRRATIDLQASDPMRQLQIRKLEADLADGKNPESVREYEYAKKNGYDGSFQDWIASKRAGAGEYSLTPVYGKDAQGNTVLIQPGKSGTAVQTKLPEGVTISSGVDKIDLGTQWGILDKRSGQIIGYQPKDLKGAESQKALGKAQGGMQATLPGDIQNAESTITQIDDLIKHPGLSSVVGPLDQFRPSWMMGSEGRDALARYNQLKGKAFLQAYSTLRGGGQITEVEGAKAENAMARMDRAQSEAEFTTALKDFRDAVKIGMQKLREKAGVSAPTGPVTINGYKIEAVD